MRYGVVMVRGFGRGFFGWLVLMTVLAGLLVVSPAVGPTPSASAAVVTPEAVSFNPFRTADTRSGLGVPAGLVPAGGTITVPVAGRLGVPANASSAAINVTVATPASVGSLTVYPCGSAVPSTPTLYFSSGLARANTVYAKLGTNGRVCVRTTAQTHVIVDVADYWQAGSAFTGVLSTRAFDTTLAANTAKTLLMVGKAGIPSGARAVAVNLTAVSPAAAGAVTVYPCGTKPGTVSLSHQKGVTVAGSVLSKADGSGNICVSATSAVRLQVDVLGYAPSASLFTAIAPARAASGSIAAGGTLKVTLGGKFGLPAGAGAASLTVTSNAPAAAGDLTVYPCGNLKPGASILNYSAGQAVSNSLLARIGSQGQVCVTSSKATAVALDVTGYYKGSDVGQGATDITVGGPQYVDYDGRNSVGSSGHSCALMPGGYVRCWGDNSRGQVGDGSATSRSAPVNVSGVVGATDIDAGPFFTCAVVGATVKCWGAGYAATPVAIAGTTGATAVSGTCAIVSSSVKCWTASSRSAVPVAGTSGAVALATGSDDRIPGYVGCAVLGGGSVTCWFGYYSWESADAAKPVPGVSGATAITANPDRACAVVSGGAVRCWEVNGSTPAPSLIPGITGATALTSAPYQYGDGKEQAFLGRVCALVAGTQKCWGGEGLQPGQSGVTGLSAIDDSGTHLCGIVAGGSVKCWGNDSTGALGSGRVNGYSAAPVAVAGISGATDLATEGPNNCALTGGVLKCWGATSSDADTLLGKGTYPVRTVAQFNGATAIALGYPNTRIASDLPVGCAVRNGNVACGPLTAGATLRTVPGFSGATKVVIGGTNGWQFEDQGEVGHTCAIVAGGAVWCQGHNQYGQLGIGSVFPDYSDTAVKVVGISGAVDIYAGNGDYTCALVAGGTVKCWGDGYGATPVTSRTGVKVLGDYCDILTTGGVRCGTRAVSGINSATSISGSCAVDGGAVKCWGDDHIAVPLVGISSATEVDGNCAIAAGAVKCWGDNRYGQLTINPGWNPVTPLL